ncbi:MAG: permease [Candidatus Omnitrophica bacterium]|nr:permease [Candidatus Omnitrophota bacterium]
MEFLNRFIQAYWMYCQEIWLSLAIGFFISGFFYKFIPTDIVDRHLGEKGIKPIIISAIFGTFLPVCCIGSLPIAVTLRRKGASLGAVMAFMVATPATSISALLVCWRLLGLTFTVVIFVGVIIMAIIMGVVMNGIEVKTEGKEKCVHDEHCCHDEAAKSQEHKTSVKQKIKDAVVYAFVTLPKEIGLEIIIGIAIASFIAVFGPIQYLIQKYFSGLMGYLFILIIGLLTYVCSTASVPMADAFIKSGLSQGQALCYLLVGPITSYGTILVIKNEFGYRILCFYLGIISLLSLIYGLMFDVYLSTL